MATAQMITPNQLEQAKAELNYDLGNYKIPSKIQSAEKDYYVCVCVRSTDSKNGMGKIHSAITRFITQPHWNKMDRDLKSDNPSFPMILNNLFNLVVILHNPTLKPVKEKVKQLSPTQKKAATVLSEGGMPYEDIAKDLNVSLERIQAYFK